MRAHYVYFELHSLGLAGKEVPELVSWLLPRPTPWGPHSLLPFKSLLPKQNGLFCKASPPRAQLWGAEENQKLLEHWTLEEASETP